MNSNKILPLSDLVKNYGKILPDVLKDAVQPIYDFDLQSVFGEDEVKFMADLGSDIPLEIFTPDGSVEWRGPLPGQQHVIAALTKAWKQDIRKIIIRGEAGVGKTQISLMALEMAARAGLPVYPAVIIEPRRVTKQWRERIKAIVPNAMTMKLERPADVELFASMVRVYRNRKRIFGLIPTSMLSRSPGRRASGVWVASETEKLSQNEFEYHGHSPMLVRRYDGTLIVGCPNCMKPLKKVPAPWVKKKVDTIDDMSRLESLVQRGHNIQCLNCGSPLYEDTAPLPIGIDQRERTLPYDVGEYLYRNRRRLSRFAGGPIFSTLIIDELHKMANDNTIRGATSYRLARMSEFLIGLSATIYGGTASSLFWIYFMFFPEMWPDWGDMSQAQSLWKNELANFAVIKKTDSLTAKESKRKKELPAAPPKLVAMLAPKTVHVKLSDLGIAMPPLDVSGIRVQLDPDHLTEYRKLFADLISKQQKGVGGVAGGYKLQNSLTYAISPTQEFHLDKGMKGIKLFPESYICAPERALVDFVESEKTLGRKTIIYVTHTASRDIVPRLQDVLKLSGITSVRLPKNLSLEDMPKWLDSEAPKYDSMILNQKAIEGVDAVKFQNVIFYEVDYSVYPVDQAARRHWRLGQTEACKTVFLEIEGTMLFRALALVMQKMATSSVLYGDDIEAQVGKYSAHSVLVQAIKDELAGVELPDLQDLYKKAAQAIVEHTEDDEEEKDNVIYL